ncbi:MAG: caspase family protein [Verrucomicrobiota bacterium]
MRLVTRTHLQAFASLFLAIVLASCSKNGDSNLSPEEALAVLKSKVVLPADEDRLVRISPAPLSPGDRISEEFSDDVWRTAEGGEWLFLIDRNPGAYLSRNLEYVLVRSETQIFLGSDFSEIPLVNDEAVWSDDPAYQKAIVDNTVALGTEGWQRNFNDEATPQEPLKRGPPQEEFVNIPDRSTFEECCPEPRRRFALILYNFDKGPLRKDISDNVEQMSTAMRDNGYTVPQFPSSTNPSSPQRQPAIYLGDRRGNGLQQLRDFVAEHDDEDDCCEEIFIYYSGHGKQETVSGQKRYSFGLRFNYKGEGNDRAGKKRLYAEDFAQILSGLKSRSIHIVIDACHSGGFIDALGALKGVETIRTSCSEDEKAWSGQIDRVKKSGQPLVQDPYGQSQGEKGSEFTSGFAKGIREHNASRPSGSPPTPARRLTDIGFVESGKNDVTALSGKTNPTGQTRIDSKDCNCCPDENDAQ